MLQRVYTCYSQVRNVRTVSKKGVAFRKAMVSNPGIENRVNIIKMESTDGNLEVDDLNLDDLESDFAEAGDLHREYEREKRRASRALSFNITKRKYFKSPKLPNLLMWSEKEQIRNLHQLDPKEWDAENLSKSFPAPIHVIKKILKSNWKPKNKDELERHDRAVQKNWNELMKGGFNLNNDLKCHILSFSSRRHLLAAQDSTQNSEEIIIYNQPTKSSEFSDIVKKTTLCGSLCDAGKDVSNCIEVDIPELMQKKIKSKTSDLKSETHVLQGGTPFKQELMSYREFKEELANSVGKDAEENELSKKYSDYLNEGNGEEKQQSVPHQESLPDKLKRESKLTKYKKEDFDYNLTPQQLDTFMKAENHRNKIKIPKEKKDPSAVYKVKDCFYDTDGIFLYRVPGMK